MDTKKPFARFYQVINVVFILLCIFAAVGFIVTSYSKGGLWQGFLFIFGELTVGEFLIGIGTAILATYTAMLAVIGAEDAEKNREQMAQEAEKDRIRDSLKERLVSLYSPLIGLGDLFVSPAQHGGFSQKFVKKTMGEIRAVYSYLASDTLKVLLDNYYKNYFFTQHLPDEVLLKNIRQAFTSDYDTISKEYRELTLSMTDKKHRVEIAKNASEAKTPR